MTKEGPLNKPQVQPGSAVRLFGREWMRSPSGMGAVAPSGAALARAITAGTAGIDGPVIELGPGTGVFTAALLKRNIAPRQIATIEASAAFAVVLTSHYPNVNVIHGDAARVRHLSPFGLGGAASVVCGLPLLSMPPEKVMRILAGSFAALRPGGTFSLFTYGPRCPISNSMRSRLGIVARRTAFVLLNIPPATVYTLTQTEKQK